MHACRAFARTVPESDWWLHDKRAFTFQELSRAAGNCFLCQASKSVYGNGEVFQALSIGDLIKAIASPVELLDLDAQGADVELLESVADSLHSISRVKIECQELRQGPGFLYTTSVPNRCSRAEQFLKNAGFVREALRINNCACIRPP